MEEELLPPPSKIYAPGYRYCRHCKQHVSQRTWRKHSSLPSIDEEMTELSSSGSSGTSTEITSGANTLISMQSSAEDAIQSNESHNQETEEILEDEDRIFYEAIEQHSITEFSSSEDEVSSSDDEGSSPDGEGKEKDDHVGTEKKSSKSLLHWLIIFLSVWQSVFGVSDKAMAILLKFLKSFVRVMLSNASKLKDFTSMMPGSMYLFRKFFPNEDEFIKYIVCPLCYKLYLTKDCYKENEMGQQIPVNCSHQQFPNHPHEYRRMPCNAPLLVRVNRTGGQIKYEPRFLYAYQPIKQSLQRLLRTPGFEEKLEHWRTRETIPNVMCDVYDGQVWKDFHTQEFNFFLERKRSIGFMLNFDFFQPFKHVQQSYGVLYLTIMNLPRSERFKQQNVLIVGVIPPFEHEPESLNTFLTPLVEELKEFWNPGVRLYTYNSPWFKLYYKAALMCVACDIPASRKCCGFKGHSANYGCNRCQKFFPGGFGKKDFGGFDRSTWPPRSLHVHRLTCAKLKKCTTTAAIEQLQTETGIKYSILIELTYFDPIRFTVIDPMHNLFLGTGKYVMKKLWIEKGVLSPEQLKIIQQRVDSYPAPHGIGRIPRKIATSFGGFTAEQWKNWIILYSLFALRGILPDDHYKCWQSFVLACFFLCRRAITNTDLLKADHLLIKFCETIERLFGSQSISPNMHLHAHLSHCIKDYGSIYGFWLFSFERYNGLLEKYSTNNREIAVQLMRRFIYECGCLNADLPKEFNEDFEDIFVFDRLPSEVHQHIVCERAPINRCSNLDTKSLLLPSLTKTSALTADDCNHLKNTYAYLYQTAIHDTQMTISIKVFKHITLYGQFFGSAKHPQSKHSSYLLAPWTDSDGNINEDTIRPGRVLQFFSHKLKINDNFVEHIFALVAWFSEHPQHQYYGKPLEVWRKTFIPDGPSTFLPVHKIHSRCIAQCGRLVCPEQGIEDMVMFVSPLPNIMYF